MSSVLSRLRTLRQQSGIAELPPPGRVSGRVSETLFGSEITAVAATPIPKSVSDTLPDTLPGAIGPVPDHIRRLLGIRSKAVPPRAPVSTDRHVPGVEIAPGLFYTEHHHSWTDAPSTIDAGFAKLGRFTREQLLYFDTETTGLAGGTGTRAFMIGAADWRDGGLRLRQLTMATMAAEAAMLRTFADWLSPDSVLVSYNGKCYDSPLLNTRYRLARMQSPIPGLAHLDLLHPSRRRWKGQWENCRLGTLERQVLGIVRDDDLPGSEAPRAWLDYLRGGSARNLRRVAEHNGQDLRSLAGLCLHLSALESMKDSQPFPGEMPA